MWVGEEWKREGCEVQWRGEERGEGGGGGGGGEKGVHIARVELNMMILAIM